MAEIPSKAANIPDTVPPATETQEFDEDTLRAIVEVYNNEGESEYNKNEYSNAIGHFTEGIKANCKDVNLNAVLFTNRAASYFCLGDYQQTLKDAKAARNYTAANMKAIETGARACVELNLFEEAAKWCDDGLSIEPTNENLWELKRKSGGSHASKTSDIDDKTLKAIAEVYNSDGEAEVNRFAFNSAVNFFTKGIQVNCKDDHLNAALYTNRAAAHFCLREHFETLCDAKEARKFKSSYFKAILIGACACFNLSLYEEAMDWCNEGLEIDPKNETLLEIIDRSVKAKDTSADNTKSKAVGENGGGKMGCVENSSRIKFGERGREARAYVNIGLALHERGDFKKAIEYHQLGASLAKEVGHRTEEGRAYACLGIAYDSLGDFRKAIEYHQLDLRMANEDGDIDRKGRAYTNLGIAYTSLGDVRRAIEYHNLSLNIFKEVENRVGEAHAYANLGNAYLSLGDFRKAIECFEIVISIAKEGGGKHGVEEPFSNLGNAYYGLGNFKRASEYHQLDLCKAKEVGNEAGKGRAYANLGSTYNALGDFRRAIEYYQLGLKLFKESGNTAREGNVYCNLGSAYSSLGDYKKAIEYQELSLKIAKEVRSKGDEGRSYGNLGNAHLSQGDFKQALEFYQLHLSIAKEIGDKAGEGSACCNIGSAYKSLGEFDKAMEFHQLSLNLFKEVGDKAGEGGAYGNLGIVYSSLGDFRKAIEHHQLRLGIAKEVQDRAGEGRAYGNLGNAYQDLGDFRKAIEYQQMHLSIAKEVNDRAEEGRAYSSLGSCYHSIGDFKKAIDYQLLGLSLTKEVGSRAEEGKAYGNIGISYHSLGDFKTAIDYHQLHLSIAKEVGDRAAEASAYSSLGNCFLFLGDLEKALEYYQLDLMIVKELGKKGQEGGAYGNIGNVYFSLGDFRKALDYHLLHLDIVKELGKRAEEGSTYSNIGNTYAVLGDFKKSKECHMLHLDIAKEVGDRVGEACAYTNIAHTWEYLGDLCQSELTFKSSIEMFEEIRSMLQTNDQWKISLRDHQYDKAYVGLLSVLLKQGKVTDALLVAERGRAQALTDLLKSQYGFEETAEQSEIVETLSYITTQTVFIAVGDEELHFWVLNKGDKVDYRQKKIEGAYLKKHVTNFLQSLTKDSYAEMDVNRNVSCEDRFLNGEIFGRQVDVNYEGTTKAALYNEGSPLNALYQLIVDPIVDLIEGYELIIVPEGPLFLAPYAAFLDHCAKFLCESFRVRLAPSLTTLQLITESPKCYHSEGGALLVGDPWVSEVTDVKGEPLDQLPYARKEVEMIGNILNIKPVIGQEATKAEVMILLQSVALVHIAAHGSFETGEIALSPNPTRSTQAPKKEDYILTMKDVLSLQLRARLVMLSCCHSGHGEVKAEGVVGIARAFLGAGARAVLVALWAIDDEATLEFMRFFYQHLATGKGAGEALNQARASLRKSASFKDVKHWASFMLIGDDVTLNFAKIE